MDQGMPGCRKETVNVVLHSIARSTLLKMGGSRRAYSLAAAATLLADGAADRTHEQAERGPPQGGQLILVVPLSGWENIDVHGGCQPRQELLHYRSGQRGQVLLT